MPGAEKGQTRLGMNRRPPACQPTCLPSVPQWLPGDPRQHNSDQLGQGRGRKSGKGLRVRCLSLCSHGCLSLCLSGSTKEYGPSPSFSVPISTGLSSPACLKTGSPSGKSWTPSGVIQFPVVSGPTPSSRAWVPGQLALSLYVSVSLVNSLMHGKCLFICLFVYSEILFIYLRERGRAQRGREKQASR